MKGTTFILLCAVALANGDTETVTTNQDERICNYDPEVKKICEASIDTKNVLIAHEYCNKFYKCSNGQLYAYKCAANLLYDPMREQCEWPHLVDCGDRPLSSDDDNLDDADCEDIDNGSGNDVPDNGNDDNGGSGDSDNNSSCNCNPEEAPSICAGKDSDGILIAHENCNQFYKCAHGKPVEFSCGPNTLFNPYTNECDWPTNVECGDRLVPESNENDSIDNDGNDDGGNDNNGDNDNGGTCNCNPEEAPSICAGEDSDGILIAHENCNQFYKCAHGKPVEFSCGSNTLFNPYTNQCDWTTNVECGDRVVPESNENDGVDNDDCGNDNTCNDNNESNDNSDACNCNPEEAPSICAGEDSDGILVAHENCNQFYKCAHGKPVEFSCGPNTLFNPYTEQCDWATNVKCGDRLVPESNDNDGVDNDDNDDGGNDNGVNDNGGTDNNGSNDNEDPCNCNPEEAPSICAGDDSDGVLIAHENCNQFYKCAHGKPVEFSCGPNTLFNPYTNECDWPTNVECGDRLVPESNENDSIDNDGNDDGGNDNNGDNDNGGTCNCNPEEAPSICAGEDSDGILIAHENCNQFYKCAHGKPVEFSCGSNTLFNPYTNQCDWTTNVECGDRVVPESNENDGVDKDDCGNDNTCNDNNESNDNSGACNCNPEEAPSICAGEDSDGILVAHENCNQFYKCAHGKPVEFSCGPNTLFNPYTEQCDWATNVKCGDRLVPESNDNDGVDNDDNDDGGNDNGVNDNGGTDNNGSNDNEDPCNCNPEEAPSICAGDDSDGVLIAHENCNQFYKCAHGKPVEFSCGPNTLFNPYTNECDWPTNVECGDRLVPESNENDSIDNDGNDDGGNDNNGDNDNGGTCNCNPEEAPSICAGEDSDGILIAHENCNQFYKCAHGKPVEFSCGSNTLFNPYTEQCDWPTNVECGDRSVPESNENDSIDNDGNDDGGNDNNGDNDNGGTCNCNPEEAPSICAGDDSDGILIAHENCNQFYKCAHGKPVEFSCGPNTLFNPYTDQCDWSNNVECGDRQVPESNENDGIDNDYNDDGNDNNNGDNDNGSNDNSGACNCNPEEAPSICADEESDGILIAHENCNQFYKCAHGKPVAFTCVPNTLFNPYTEQCDWVNNVDCGDREVPESNEDGDVDTEDNDAGGNDNVSNDNGSTDDGWACNCNPEEAPSICAGKDSDGVLIAHKNCNKFFKCAHGQPIEFTCGSNTLFNPYTEQCDWPSNVDCGDRVVPETNEDGSADNEDNDNGGNDNVSNENGGNDNGGACNCNPEEAPSICAGEDSDGTLIAHENCNKFFKCAHGKPVVFVCSSNTFYNPYLEQCDWASNVDCGDRAVPELDETVDENANNNSDSNNDNNDKTATYSSINKHKVSEYSILRNV